MENPYPYRLLFVCMGNICRSPAAHGVMEKFIASAGLSDVIEVDSAGTGGWHIGHGSDHRMKRHATKRGYSLTHRARQVCPSDFDDFELILIMDEQNRHDIRQFAPTAAHMRKVVFLTDFAHDRQDNHVPDPYYGEAEDFEEVLDIVENACQHLLTHVRTSQGLGVMSAVS